MLRKYARLYVPDANTDSTSSTESDDKGQPSSTAEQTATTTEDSTEETSEETTEGTESTEETQETPVTDATETETQAEQTEQTETVPLDKPEDKDLPFHKHARFQELVAEKNAVKQEYEQAKPLVDQARVTNEFLRDNHITAQEYQNALQYLSLLRKDPVAAFKMLQPTYEQLAALNGERLTPDLQAEVAAGTLTEERARQIARGEAQQRYAQWQQQQGQQGQQQSQVELINGTIQNWSQSKVDPDFKPGTPLWEQVDLRIRSLPPFRSVQEAFAGCEKAYTDAKQFFTKLQPRTATTVKRPPLSRQTVNNGNVVMKTAADVMKAINAGIKPNQMRYS